MKDTCFTCRLVTTACAALCLAAPGCVRRTLTVNTVPQGARVILNDEEIGTSPVQVDFLWYGDYDVILRKDGYRTLRTHQKIDAPWYQIPPMDFFAETLIPVMLHDQQQMSFTLEPAQPIDKAELIQKAGEVRERALFSEE
ncbi:MAG TPA: PEGA domain-containing protein [Phycisphaerae bacterium]|nr:PEGA domain-containing protein [Phycisphaerae bacterium]HRY67306.1 PEGA domain-containing protein [Phycisphaerae bacterium]HSA28449.1 PEGA domain-containing protein [Phycisphaerae bacterium]